jgi:hypothetical protein
VASSHTSQRLRVSFDEPRLIPNAGLLLPAILAQRLDLVRLIDEQVDLGKAVGRAHPGAKAMTLIASQLAGGDCISQADSLRAAGMEEVLGHRIFAPSTLGTFLRSFTYGHSRQLEKVSELALSRAWQLGLGPGDGPLTIDLDSTICETYGEQKQGAQRRTYAKVRGYHPFLAIGAGSGVESGEILHWSLRGGRASPHRGAARFCTETLKRVRRAGARGALVVRGDSGFYTAELVGACRAQGVQFSITARQYGSVVKAIAEIPEAAWSPIPWAPGGSAEVAETDYLAFANSHHGKAQAVATRLIVRRDQKQQPKGQLQLPGLYDYHAFITDRTGPVLELEAEHRGHAVVENQIRELKYDLALNHLPSGRFAANAVWLALTALAHNLAHWVAQLALERQPLTVKTVRRCFFSVPGRLVRSGRRRRLRLPSYWPWARQFLRALERLRPQRSAQLLT